MKKILKKLHEWGNRHEWILILLILVIILRLPSLFTPHYYGDEEIYFVMGRAWRTGVPMYQAMFDHKPPLIYILAGIAQNVFWFRTMLMGAMLLHTWLFYRLAKLFWVNRPKLMYVSTALFLILTTAPTLEGNIVNAELFMMVPITASLLMLWKSRRDTGDRKGLPYMKYVLAGLVAGIGWLFKVPVVMDFMAIAIYLFIFREKSFKGGLKGLFSPGFWLYVIGFALPLASTFVYYYAIGHGQSYLDTVLKVNLGYVSSWSTSQFAFNPFKSGLVIRGIVLAVFTVGLYIVRKKLDNRLTLVLLWTAFSFFGALLSGRPYPHYLQEPIVPLSLLLPYVVIAKSLPEWIMIGYLAIWGVVTHKQIGFWGYPSVPLYKNFAEYANSKISKQEYFERFDGARRNYAIANYLNPRMTENDQIYLWGSDSAIYNLTDRLPTGGKYIVDFHVRDFRKFDYVMANLAINKPKFIVILPNSAEFPELEKLVSDEYIQVYTTEKANVYMRLGL